MILGYYRLLALNMSLGFLSYFVPKKKNKILIGASVGSKFVGSPKYFFLYLCKNETSLDVSWITKNKELVQKLRERKLPVEYLYSWRGIKAILRSKYLIISHLISDVSYAGLLPGNFHKTNTWHGTPLKKVEAKVYGKNPNFRQKLEQRFMFMQERKSYHTVLASSEEVKKIIFKEFQSKNVKILGYPRNDVFFNSDLIFENYSSKLNLDKYEKIILYCPTYRDNPTSKIPFSNDFLKKLNSHMLEINGVFLIKKHVLDKSVKKLENFSNIIDVSSDVEDIQDLLVHVDVIITDYSSIFFDFALLNRPMIFYPYDLKEYLQTRELYYDYFAELPGPFSKNEDELLEIIKSIDVIFQEKLYQEKYIKFRNRFNSFLDGNSCKRLIEYLENG